MVALDMPREYISHPVMKQVTVALVTVNALKTLPGLAMP
jgi:hypothetical protein